MGEQKAIIRKKVSSCFFILVILMSLVPVSAFAAVNSNISSDGVDTASTDLTIEEVNAIIKSATQFILLDIRTEKDHRSGHIYGAMPIPLSELEDGAEGLDEKDRKIIVYDKNGVEGKIACDLLIQHGFENVYNMKGGINAWTEAGFATVTYEFYKNRPTYHSKSLGPQLKAMSSHVIGFVDIVFIMDTSGSMNDEIRTLCDNIPVIVSGIESRGHTVNYRILGLHNTWHCADQTVEDYVRQTGNSPVTNHKEDWGPGTQDISNYYDWTPNATRVIVPMSDEAPENGDSCSSSDSTSITNAINAANRNNVRVCPIKCSEQSSCAQALADRLASETRGTASSSTAPTEDLVDIIEKLITDIIYKPIADAGSDQTVVVGSNVRFDGSGSYDPNGEIVGYRWDFDASDGVNWESPDAYGACPKHTYTVAGIYNVSLMVRDNDEVADTDTVIISVVPDRISYLTPPDSAILSAKDVLFTWKTSLNSTTEIYIKAESETEFTRVGGQNNSDHAVTINNLSREASYIWYAQSCSAYGCAISDQRSFYIDKGIVFTRDRFDFTIERNYSQRVSVSVENRDTEAHDLLVRTSNPYDDLYYGFIGGGSADRIISLAPKETKEIALVIHAQDAMLEDYTFAVNLTNLGAENITDYALVHLHVPIPHIEYDITEVSTDPITMSKTIRITNRGDPVTDLSLTPDERLKGDVIIQPSLAHCSLGTGESVDLVISPIWSESIRDIHGSVTATVADQSRELSVDYSCGEGKEMYEVTMNHPILYYDLRGAWCINCHHVEDIFNLPPGFVQGNVVYAYIGMELAAKSGQTRPYNVYIAVNGHSVGTLSNTFPRGYYEFDIDSSYLNYATAGTAENMYTLDTDMPGSYMTPLSNVRVVMCLDVLKLHICAESAEQAEEIAWSAPYIHKPSGSITVNVLSPEGGSPLNLNQPVLIKAEVLGDDGKEKRCTVKATFSCCDDEIALVDNGLHDDGQAGDGVYANTWIPGIAGSCEITVSASNCASTGYDITAVTVNTSKPDLTLTQRDIGFKNSFRKVRSNNLYLIEGKLTNITATIHNLGSGDAKDVIVCFYDEHPSSGEVIGSTTIPQLSSRTTENVSISWNPTPVGEHNITVVLDPDNLIPELNETNNNATQNVSVVSSLSINDTILMVDKNPMFDNGSSVINLTSSHEIVAVGSIIQPIVSSNTTLDASIHVKLSDISGNVIWQSLKTGKIYLTVNSSSNDITLFIEPDSIFDIPDNPNYYGIRTLELIAIPSSEVIGVIDINRTIYASPYDLTTYSESGTYFYRFSGGRTLTGDSPIGIICSPEFEQHFAYDASYNETTTTYDITIPVFVAHEELVGLTELAKKYPNAEVKIIPYTGDLGGMKNTIQWHVQNYRSRGITPLIVGVVPHFHVEYHELKVSKAYKATYMSYAMACNINNEILWDGLDKQALVSDNFRSDEIAKPLIAGENPKYSKDSTQLGSINDYPVVLLCRKDLPLLQIAPTLSTKEVRENGSLQDNYTIYRVGPLVPIGHTYYVGASGSVPLCTISLNPTALSLNFGYGITLPIINQDVGLSFALIGGMQGISGVLKILTFDEVTGSLHDLLYDERTVGICPACVTFKVADYLPFTSLLNSMDEFFQEFFTAFATGLYQPLIVGLNAEDYLEPSNIFTILKTTAGDLGSSPQPVYYSVENVRETYPSSVVGVNLAMSAIAGLSSLAEFGKLFGFTISPTFTGSPEVLHYTGTVNDVNLIMLMDDIKNIEEHPFTYKIPQKDEAEPPSGVVMIEIPAKVFLGMIDLPTKTEIQKRLRATGDLRRNPINKITRAYNSVRGKYPTLGKIKQSAIKKISSALGKKNLLSKKLTIDVLKALNALGKFTATYAEAMDVATFSSQELYYFGDPTTTGYDDPVNVASPKVLPRDFNITVASEPLTLNVLNSTFVFSNVTNIGAPNITMQIITSSYAPATGYPQVPMITLAIQSPVNQVIGSIDVTLQNPSGLQNINLPMTVINTGNETMPGIIAGNMTSWPLQKWLWGSETHDNIAYTVVYLFPFEYDMKNHLGTYYGTIDVVMKTEFVSITTGTEVEIESYPNIVSMGPDSEVPVTLRVYNDYSSTCNVSNVTVTAELPQNLIVLSTDGSKYNNSGGSLMINWDIPSLTTDAYGYCKNLHLNVKSPSIISDLMTASINVSVEYTAENIIRQENLIVPIILVPSDLVDVEVKSIDVPVKMSVNNTYKLIATVKNSGKKTIAMIPVRLFLNDVIIATETIHYLENGENHILDFDFKPEHVGRYKVSVAVVQVPSEVNITNNVMTQECWVGEGLVLFDESHDEIFSIAPNAKYSYSKLASFLKAKGYEVKALDSMLITKEKLTNCSIFVISAPTKPFDTAEINAIREFVSNGGSLLLINEWGGDFRQGSNLNEIAENFGIVFRNDLVNDPTNNFHNTSTYALIHEFSDHYITKGVNEFLYPAGCSLIANNSIARADDDSYTTLPNIPMQAMAEEERGSIAVLAATNFESGRVVCIGDGDFCGDLDIDGDGRANIDEYDNKNLTLNIVTWLAQREINELPVASFSYPPPKLFTNQAITFNASSSYDPDGTIGNYEWEFGDGANGTGEIVTYSYFAAGIYNVALTVTDNGGDTSTTTEKIEVLLNATYVPDDYPKIQAAVDAASVGDTIIVRDGIYTENIDVNKRLMIRSENGAATTIVQAENSNDHVFAVTADYVNLSGFTVEGAVGGDPLSAGIYLEADYCTIVNNIIVNNYDGLCLRYSLNNLITSNNITDNTRHGIELDWDCNHNTIYGNSISLNEGGLSLDSSSNNVIYNNTINSNRGYGGISFYSASRYNRIYLNNFINNSENAITHYALSNVWNSPGEITYTYNSNTCTNYLGNYWHDYTGYDLNHDGIGDTAYIIYSERDNYSLIQQWEKYFG